MSIVWLGLGSNIGDRKAHIESALKALDSLLRELVRAPLYETSPRDFEDQDDFLNTVVRGLSDLPPSEFLARIQEIEYDGGRTRDGIPKGPRTIDIDILLWDDSIIETGTDERNLIVPHQAMHERLFVLKPLLDLNPALVDPRDGISWADKASRLNSQQVMLYKI